MRNISDQSRKSERQLSSDPTSSLSEVLARISAQWATEQDCKVRQAPLSGMLSKPCGKDTVHPRTCGTITRNYYKLPNLGNYLLCPKPEGTSESGRLPRIRMLTEVECERLQGFPDDFTKYGVYSNEVKPISRANRYAMLGNAVIVPVVRAVASRIRENTILNK